MDHELIALLDYLDDVTQDHTPREPQLVALVAEHGPTGLRQAAEQARALRTSDGGAWARAARAAQGKLMREITALYEEPARIGTRDTFPIETTLRRRQLENALRAGDFAQARLLVDDWRGGACEPWAPAQPLPGDADDWNALAQVTDLATHSADDLLEVRKALAVYHRSSSEARALLDAAWPRVAAARPDLWPAGADTPGRVAAPAGDATAAPADLWPVARRRRKTTRGRSAAAVAAQTSLAIGDPAGESSPAGEVPARRRRSSGGRRGPDRPASGASGGGPLGGSGVNAERSAPSAQLGPDLLGHHTLVLRWTEDAPVTVSLVAPDGGAVALLCDHRTGQPSLSAEVQGRGAHTLVFVVVAAAAGPHRVELVLRAPGQELQRVALAEQVAGTADGWILSRAGAALGSAAFADAGAEVANVDRGVDSAGETSELRRQAGTGAGAGRPVEGLRGDARPGATGTTPPGTTPPRPGQANLPFAPPLSRDRRAGLGPVGSWPPGSWPPGSWPPGDGPAGAGPVGAGPAGVGATARPVGVRAQLPLAPPEPPPSLPDDLQRFEGTQVGAALAVFLRDRRIDQDQLFALGGGQLVRAFGIHLDEACEGKDWEYRLDIVDGRKHFCWVRDGLAALGR